MSDKGKGEPPRKMWERPHEYEGKIIHVGTPGIFHARNPRALGATYCGIVMVDPRATDHQLLDQQPCAVCFAPRASALAGSPDKGDDHAG